MKSLNAPLAGEHGGVRCTPHRWAHVLGLAPTTRRCLDCHALGRLRQGNGPARGAVTPIPCRVCGVPATGQYYDRTLRCADHLPPPPGNPRTLTDMSETEIAALEREYGVPVRRPG